MKSGSRPCLALDATVTSGSRAPMRRNSAGLRTPPPQTSSRFTPGRCASSASATVAAVSSSNVACTSAGANACSPSRACTQSRWNCSRPVLLGGGSANHGSASSRASKASLICPLAANAPSASNAWPRWRWHQPSSSALAGPASKPRRLPSGASRLRLAMPPRLSTARSSSLLPSIARWNAGISGAPCPPAATSRRRKSATAAMPVSSAMRLASPICQVKAGTDAGRWRMVCPCEPIARTCVRSTPASSSKRLAASAKAMPTCASSCPSASSDAGSLPWPSATSSAADFRCPLEGMPVQQTAATGVGKLHQRRINAIGAGAGHQAEIKVSGSHVDSCWERACPSSVAQARIGGSHIDAARPCAIWRARMNTRSSVMSSSAAKRCMDFSDGLRTPRSIPLTYVLSTPAFNASASRLRPNCSRNWRKAGPT